MRRLTRACLNLWRCVAVVFRIAARRNRALALGAEDPAMTAARRFNLFSLVVPRWQRRPSSELRFLAQRLQFVFQVFVGHAWTSLSALLYRWRRHLHCTAMGTAVGQLHHEIVGTPKVASGVACRLVA
jgi:hypothetical protein